MNKADIRLQSIKKWSLIGLPFSLLFTPSDADTSERVVPILLVVLAVALLGMAFEKFSTRSAANTKQLNEPNEEAASKSCLACCAAIQLEAVKCRYCGTSLGKELSPTLIFTSLLLSSFIACSQWVEDISSRVQSVDAHIESVRIPDVDSIASHLDTISSAVENMSSEVSDIEKTVHDIDGNTAR